MHVSVRIADMATDDIGAVASAGCSDAEVSNLQNDAAVTFSKHTGLCISLSFVSVMLMYSETIRAYYLSCRKEHENRGDHPTRNSLKSSMMR